MKSRIMTGKMPLPIPGGNDNIGDFVTSHSGFSVGQGSISIMDRDLPPLDVTPNVSENDFEEEKSGSENQEADSADEPQQQEKPRRKRKRYHRHTPYQIREMETFFKDCPHPDEKQRKQLSRDLGLGLLQVKFWFQNKRTQMKTLRERKENAMLKAENERLHAENVRYRQAVSNTSCPNCGGPAAVAEMSIDEHQLRLENSRLREEIESISGVAETYVSKPFPNPSLLSSTITEGSLEIGMAPSFVGQPDFTGDLMGSGELLRSLTEPNELDKPMVINLAVASLKELISMTQIGEPLWMPKIDGESYVLNEEEYTRIFPGPILTKLQGFKSEGSRETAVVKMSLMRIVEIFMDLSKWLAVYSSIVSRSIILEQISTGIGEAYNGTLQMMSAEFQVLSPVVPTRDCIFVRYCKKLNDGLWAIVDVSLDRILPGGSSSRCQKKPSGLLISEISNGISKVTWVEHVDVNDGDIHYLARPLINSGLAYGAKRWLSVLDRQAERLAIAMGPNIPSQDLNKKVLANSNGRNNLLKLSERMVLSFCGGVTSSTAYSWTIVSGDGVNQVRIMTRSSVEESGRPSGVVMSATICFWLPAPPKDVFDFIRDENNRCEWDILSNTGHVEEIAQIANGRETGNFVSLIKKSGNATQGNIVIVQESSTDPTSSFVIYAPVDIASMNILLDCGNPDNVALLPSGYIILPTAPPSHVEGTGEAAAIGTLLTIAFQILIDKNSSASKLSNRSVTTVNTLIDYTTRKLKQKFLPKNA